jgi:hypothetical protein
VSHDPRFSTFGTFCSFGMFCSFDRINSAVLGVPNDESPLKPEFLLRNEKKRRLSILPLSVTFRPLHEQAITGFKRFKRFKRIRWFSGMARSFR